MSRPRISKHGPPTCSAVLDAIGSRRARSRCSGIDRRNARPVRSDASGTDAPESLGTTRDRGWHGLPTTHGDSEPKRSRKHSPRQRRGGLRSTPATRRSIERRSVPESHTTSAMRSRLTRTSCDATHGSRGTLRAPTSPKRLYGSSWQTDVRDILPSVHAPTALIVGDGDPGPRWKRPDTPRLSCPTLPSTCSRAARGSRSTRRWTSFAALQDVERRRPSSSILATVLFTDIVESTKKQAELGDRKWQELLLAHHSAVRDALSQWGGNRARHRRRRVLRELRRAGASHPLCARDRRAGQWPRHRDEGRGAHRRV